MLLASDQDTACEGADEKVAKGYLIQCHLWMLAGVALKPVNTDEAVFLQRHSLPRKPRTTSHSLGCSARLHGRIKPISSSIKHASFSYNNKKPILFDMIKMI